MADISRITDLSGVTYDLKDSYAMSYPYQRSLGTRTYNEVIATSNDNVGGGFFYLGVRPTAYQAIWRVKVRVRATIPEGTNAALYNTDSTFEVWGQQNSYSGYISTNHILSTSYRPIYYHSLFLANSTGYNNGCSHYIGFSLYNSTNPLNASLSRTIIVDVLEYDNCTVELFDSLITPTNIPERAAHTGWYSSTNTSFTNFDACSNGIKQTGDANTTSISNLYVYNGHYQADSAIYRYQLLFQKDENKLTPLNNVSNTTGTGKAMLTEVEFDPFGRIFYYNSTTTVSAGNNVGAGSLFYGISGFDLRYTLNCGTTLTAHKPVYLVVTITNGKAKIANTTPWAQALPDLKDGKYYILLGRAYSTYQISLHPCHPVYYYDDGIKELSPGPEKANKKDTVLDTTLSRGRMANTTVGTASFAFGQAVEASGTYSHAEGQNTTANGVTAHAEGYNTVAGDYAHAEGAISQAPTMYSHAEGFATQANGYTSHVEGIYNVASASYEHVQGTYNYDKGLYPAWVSQRTYHIGDRVSNGNNGYECIVENADTSFTTAKWEKLPSNGPYAFVVGNGTKVGTEESRSNALALTWDGDLHLKGDLYVNANERSDNGTKLDVEYLGKQVIVSTTEPQETNNKIWVDSSVHSSYSVPTYSEFLSIQNTINGKIQAPSNPPTGAFLVYNGTAWVAQTLSTWQGGNY